MATTAGNICIPECLGVKNSGAAGVCTEVGKRKKTTHRGLGCPSLPNCCTCYPPGSTLLECRLEGDQPVAHVVQVPGQGYTANQKARLVVETQGTQFGPVSRIVSQPQEDPTRPAEALSLQAPTAYCLESSECRGGPVARAVIVPAKGRPTSKVTTLETTTGEGHYDKPTSKIEYESMPRETAVRVSDDEPMTIINCKANRKQTAARVTRCSMNNASPGPKTHFETCVPRDGNCPTAVGFVRSGDEESSNQCVFETSIDECGISRACMDSCPQLDQFRGCLETRPCKDGPVARVTQQRTVRDTIQEPCTGFKKFQEPMREIYRTPSDCMVTCSGYKKSRSKHPAKEFQAKTERRNGLDASDQEYTSNPFKKPIKKQRQVCPRHCCSTTHKPMSSSFSHEHSQRPQSATARFPEHCFPAERPKSCLDSPKCLEFQPDPGDHASEPMGTPVPCTDTTEPKPKSRTDPPDSTPIMCILACTDTTEPKPKSRTDPPDSTPIKCILACTDTTEPKHKSRTDPPDSTPIKCILVPGAFVSKKEEAKSEVKSKEQIKERKVQCVKECPKPKKEKVDPCTMVVTDIKSEELLTRYREYMSPDTLRRYEAGRSKRNGLQDEVTLPVPRIVLQLKNKELQEQCRHESAKLETEGERP